MPTEMDHDRLFKEPLTAFFWEFLDLFYQTIPEQTDTLAVDLLDFDVLADLEAWLSANTPQ